MRLTILPEIFDAFPKLQVVALLARGIENRADRPALSATWNEAWANAREAGVYGNAQSHPRVRPWRDAFQALGYSGKNYPSSIEAILRRALRGGEPFRINPLVDFYNMVSLVHLVPAGGFDVSGVSLIELRFTREGDTFQALDEDEVTALPSGEVGYAVGDNILTRHFVWRQSRDGLIQEHTTDALILVEVLGDLPPEVGGEVEWALREGIERHFGVRATGAILTQRQPEHSW